MKRGLALLLALCLLLGLTACGGNTEETTLTPETTEDPTPQNTMTGEELMEQIKIGWNLGNTFDAPDGETAWGMPFTTQELLQKVKDLGFNAIRIPISWHKHVSEGPEYTIDETWMNRIDTVVNQALDCGLYVIINSHHDNSVYMPTPENQEDAVTYLTTIWKQIAEHFKDTDHRLIFQGMNEPRVEGTSYEWSVDTKNEASMAAVDVVNVLNQTVVDTIRATGGYNAERFIIVSPYAANSYAALISRFQMPEDPAGKLILSIHAYTPYNLCLNTDTQFNSFGKSDYSDIKSFMRSLHSMYVEKGIPVIIDEMGCVNKDNPEDRYEWAKYYISTAKSYGLVCCWWDNGVTTQGTEGFGILNRRKLTVFEQSQRVYEGLMEGLAVTTE